MGDSQADIGLQLNSTPFKLAIIYYSVTTVSCNLTAYLSVLINKRILLLPTLVLLYLSSTYHHSGFPFQIKVSPQECLPCSILSSTFQSFLSQMESAFAAPCLILCLVY